MNLDVGVLVVARSLVVAPGGLAEKSTKTDRSRKVALDPVGMDIRTVADFLGHSDPSLTLPVYSHAIEERTRAAATIMGQVLAARKEPAGLPSGA